MLEYFQQLQDKVLAKNAIFLGDTEGSQVVGTKNKKITTEDEKR